MKNPLPHLLITLTVLLTFVGAGWARAQNYPIPRFAYALSPDHPKTWVDGATRTHQSLRWEGDKHLLVADVTYSTADYADNTHPPEEDDFTLPLPTVHLDASSGKFTAGGVTVATLRRGFFGPHVALAPDVQLSIHRHHGVVWCALIPGNSD